MIIIIEFEILKDYIYKNCVLPGFSFMGHKAVLMLWQLNNNDYNNKIEIMKLLTGAMLSLLPTSWGTKLYS